MSTLQKRTDEELVVLYQSGNNGAFEVLLLRHKDLIYSRIFYHVKDHDLSNDIFQETFIKVVHSIKQGTYKETGRFKYWALRIAHNLIIDNVRSKKKVQIVSETTKDGCDLLNNANLCEQSIEDDMVEEQIHQNLRELIQLLPENQKNTLQLRFYDELSFKEISERTGVSINTSLGRMRYAIMNLRRLANEKNISLQL